MKPRRYELPKPENQNCAVVNAECRASIEELARLNNSQRGAFLDGVSRVIGAMKIGQEQSQ